MKKQTTINNYVENLSKEWIYTLKMSIKPGGRVPVSHLKEVSLNWRKTVENIDELIIVEDKR